MMGRVSLVDMALIAFAVALLPAPAFVKAAVVASAVGML
jgi:hypothetical protein